MVLQRANQLLIQLFNASMELWIACQLNRKLTANSVFLKFIIPLLQIFFQSLFPVIALITVTELVLSINLSSFYRTKSKPCLELFVFGLLFSSSNFLLDSLLCHCPVQTPSKNMSDLPLFPAFTNQVHSLLALAYSSPICI